MILDPALMGKWADPKYHLAHFHTSRGMGLSNVLAALMAGIYRFEATLSGVGGQPANLMDGSLIRGTGKYYHKEHLLSGLVGIEDVVVMLESMGVKTGVDIKKLLETGRIFRDEYLRIQPDQMDRMLDTVQAFTGIDRQRLVGLRDDGETIEGLVEEALKRVAQPEEDPQLVRDNLELLFHSLSIYVRTGSWGVSRAETLVSGVPPAPPLAHLL
jgi:hypothetical protein